MVRSRVDLHVSCLGHMAFDAAVACAVSRVKAMLGRDNDWRIVDTRLVATHAEHVVIDRQNVFHGVRIVAIHTVDSGMRHPAHAKGCVDEDFVEDLSIGMVETWLRWSRDFKVVFEYIAGFECICRELVAACVTGHAVVHCLLGGQLSEASFIVASLGSLDVLFESCMALCAGDPLLNPSRVIAVTGKILAFGIFGGVAVGTVRVPIHSLARPMTPFAGEAILALVDIIPFFLDDVISRADGLQLVARQLSQVLLKGRFTNDTD